MRRIVENLPLKLVSVALAGVLWFVIAGEKSSEMGVSIPLELQNFPPELELTGETVDRLEVRLRASPSIIQRISAGEVSAYVDLGSMKAGEHIVHLTEATIRVPFGVRVVKITPSVLTLQLEPTVYKTVPVQPRLVGEPAAAFELGPVKSEPTHIRLAGPRSRVEEVDSVFTEPVLIERAETAVSVDVNVGLPDPLVRLEGNPRVRVTAAVRERQETRAFAALEIQVRGGADHTLQPLRVTATLAGPAPALRAVRPEDVRAQVDLSAYNGEADVPVTVALAPGHPEIMVKAVEPPRVAVVAPRQRRKS
jgi:YbbR domain-containing protein